MVQGGSVWGLLQCGGISSVVQCTTADISQGGLGDSDQCCPPPTGPHGHLALASIDQAQLQAYAKDYTYPRNFFIFCKSKVRIPIKANSVIVTVNI